MHWMNAQRGRTSRNAAHRGPQSKYHVSHVQTDISIAETCFIYLLEFDTWNDDLSSKLDDRPLSQYAVDFWSTHFNYIDMNALPAMLSELALRLLDELNPSFSRLAWTSAVCRRYGKSYSPLYYAAVIGSCHLLEVILGRGADVNSASRRCGNALQAASWKKCLRC